MLSLPSRPEEVAAEVLRVPSLMGTEVVSGLQGPGGRPQNTIILSIRNPKKVPLILGDPQVGESAGIVLRMTIALTFFDCYAMPSHEECNQSTKKS